MKDYEEFDAVGLADLVRKGEVSAEELLDEAVDRMAARNPALNAVVLDFTDVARRRIASGLPEGPLTGVPFLLKDLGAEAVDFPSHNGSQLLRNTVYDRNSSLYARLEASGLSTFGRTAAPEGGIGAATEAAVYGGPTRNPWNLDHTPGGSSGGAGAAVAAGIVPAAHGSDGGGSVRIPASSCGLFGFKPTRARLPDGPYAGEGWAGMAIDGFLTRSVRDTAVLLDICRGSDLGAPYAAPPMEMSFTEALDAPARPLRVALCTTTLTGDAIDPQVTETVAQTGRLLADMGHHVTEDRPKADTLGMMRAWTKIVACGTALWIDKARGTTGVPPTADEVEGVGRGAWAYAQGISGADYLDAVGKIHSYGREMAAFFESYDILVTATLAEPPAKIGRFDHRSEDYVGYRTGPEGIFAYSPFTAAFNATGQPAVSVPLGQSADGLPIGVHLAAPFGADAMLMSLSADLERAAPWAHRRPPRPS
ncbi:amidase [Oceanomicrobium pacificus]|uniref:Amidase n=1 Tax=Oceanomicrobium pacificus TaxID=2692916 RepID=A0A6B0TWM3_9RHOB|nr:amidase [Oceanomicrobium pacificus]MXU65672.1 amidase [Oceanomicrobium pacificus]